MHRGSGAESGRKRGSPGRGICRRRLQFVSLSLWSGWWVCATVCKLRHLDQVVIRRGIWDLLRTWSIRIVGVSNLLTGLEVLAVMVSVAGIVLWLLLTLLLLAAEHLIEEAKLCGCQGEEREQRDEVAHCGGKKRRSHQT